MSIYNTFSDAFYRWIRIYIRYVEPTVETAAPKKTKIPLEIQALFFPNFLHSASWNIFQSIGPVDWKRISTDSGSSSAFRLKMP